MHLTPMGGSGKVVEADETYFGERENTFESAHARPSLQVGRKAAQQARGRGAGRARRQRRMFHVEHADKATVNQIVVENIAHETRV